MLTICLITLSNARPDLDPNFFPEKCKVKTFLNAKFNSFLITCKLYQQQEQGQDQLNGKQVRQMDGNQHYWQKDRDPALMAGGTGTQVIYWQQGQMPD